MHFFALSAALADDHLVVLCIGGSDSASPIPTEVAMTEVHSMSALEDLALDDGAATLAERRGDLSAPGLA